MEEKFNAICIRAVNYKDNDKMLTLFSLENGLVDCILRGVKKPNAKLKFAGEVFCFAEYVVVEKSGRRTVVEANEIDGFYGIRLDVDKYYCASAVIEFLRGFTLGEDTAYTLFLNTVNVLKAIESGGYLPALCLVKYFTEGLKIAGYGITLNRCSCCGKVITDRVFFDFDDCVFKCAECADFGDIEMRFKTYNLLKKLEKLNLSELKNPQKPTYTDIFDDFETVKYALKFIDFFIRNKIGVTIKSNAAIIG